MRKMKRLTTDTERITNRSNRAFNCYLSEIQNYAPLDPQEEYELSLLMVEGDKMAKEKLIKHNLRFVVSVAKQYYGTNIGLEDLVNEGNIGLLMAAERFDPTKGFKFISYAVWWIRKTIIEFLSNKGESVRLPISKSYIVGKIREQYTILEQELKRTPNEGDLNFLLGNQFSKDDIRLFFSFVIQNNEFLDDYIGTDNNLTGSDQLINTTLPHTDSLVETNDSNYRVNRYLTVLKTNQREVVVRYYGLEGNDPTSMETISTQMGISKERVRQLREEGLKVLRTKFNFNLS